MEEYVTRLEYDEHNRRTDDEHRRINRRMEIVEESVRQIGELTASVREMAVSMNSMAWAGGGRRHWHHCGHCIFYLRRTKLWI